TCNALVTRNEHSYRADMKRVLITGASSGLGAGLALAYAEPGATLGLFGRREDALHEVARAANEKGARTFVHTVDVCDTRAVKQAIDALMVEAGGCDIAIANAGIGEGRSEVRLDAAHSASVIGVNVIGLTNTILPCAEYMRAQGSGTLVGMAS